MDFGGWKYGWVGEVGFDLVWRLESGCGRVVEWDRDGMDGEGGGSRM